jgi:TRAP-type C4-dicarboxylate transport system substrate-binding protein
MPGLTRLTCALWLTAGLLGASHVAVSAATTAPASTTASGAAPDAPVTLRVVGGLANVNQFTRHEEPFWTRELPQLTGGKLNGEVTAFDRAGIRGQDMLRLMQLGVVPFGTALLSLSGVQEPLLAAPDLAGLNPDIAALRKHIHAFRPVMASTLRERYGIELLAVYVYPAQMLFCNRPFSGLGDLTGRRIRTTGTSQADWVEAVGATPVPLPFASIVGNLRSSNIDCAITGSMSGNTIGLPELTTHIHSLAISWGMAVFGANGDAWAALTTGQRQLLKVELGKLETRIWDEASRETGDGVACNIGASQCQAGRKGAMTEVRATPQDERRRREIFASTVLARWVQRCGTSCAEAWNHHLAPVSGITARQP